MDGSIAGPALINDSLSDLQVPLLILKSSGFWRVKESLTPLFKSHQSSWVKELCVLGNSNHTDYTNTIFLKQALSYAGGLGAIKAARMLKISRTFVKAFIDMVSGSDSKNEGVLSGDKRVAKDYPEVLFEWNNTGNPCSPDLC